MLLGLAIPAAVVLTVAGPWLGFTADGDAVLPIALAGMVVGTAQGVLFAVLVGQQRHARFAWINAAGVVVSVFLSVGILIAGGMLTSYAAVILAVSAVVTLVGWWGSGLGFDRSGVSFAHFRQLGKEGLPFLGWIMANRLRGDIEVGLLATFLSQQAVGWWGAATRIIGVPLFIPTLITLPLLPALSSCRDDYPEFVRTLRHSLVLTVLLTLPVSGLIVALAPAIPAIFGWQESFNNSVPLIMVLSWQVPLVSIGMVLGTALIALGDERRWVGVNVATTILSGGMMLLAVSDSDVWFEDGAFGAAVVRVLVELVMIGGAVILLPRGTIDRGTLWVGARIVLAALSLAVVADLLRGGSVAAAILGGGLTYAAAAIALGVLRPRDIPLAWNVLHESITRRAARGRP